MYVKLQENTWRVEFKLYWLHTPYAKSSGKIKATAQVGTRCWRALEWSTQAAVHIVSGGTKLVAFICIVPAKPAWRHVSHMQWRKNYTIINVTNWLTKLIPWRWAPLEKLIATELIKKFPPFVFWNPKDYYCIHKFTLPRPCAKFRNKLFFLRRGFVSPSPNPQAGGPPLVGCLRLIIQ
jgi:hypothetical protein